MFYLRHLASGEFYFIDVDPDTLDPIHHTTKLIGWASEFKTEKSAILAAVGADIRSDSFEIIQINN